MATPTNDKIEDGAAVKDSPDEENPFDDIDISSTEGMDKDGKAEENQESPSRSKCCIVSIAAAACLFIIGIVALILHLTGYLNFKEPCVKVSHFRIQDLTMESADNPILGALDSFTGGMLGQAIPTQANLQIELTLEVNNTNPFALEYQQAETGQVYIPQFLLDGRAGDVDEEPVKEDPADFEIGSWELPKGELQSQTSHKIPVSFTGAIDLANPATLRVAPIFLEGGAFALLTTGTIRGSSWVPGFSADIHLVCLATFDNILNPGEDARKVRCRQSLSVDSRFGEVYNGEDVRRLQSFFADDQPDNPACYV